MIRALASAALLLAFPVLADTRLPTFRELEAQQAVIGKIRVETREIFDNDIPGESSWFYQGANKLHVKTRPKVIERFLLFKAGDKVSERVIEETERVLRASRFIYDVVIKPTAVRDGVVDIDVITRDTWTLEITASITRSGGENATSFGLADDNLLGTGARLGFLQTSDVDRDGTEFEFLYPQAFGGRTEVKYFQGRYDDGARYVAAVKRPFYALDARWSAGAGWEDWDRVDSIYNAGEVASEYRHRSQGGEAFGGWSAGLVDGWVHRYSAGVAMQDETYAVEPGQVAPSPFPRDHAVRGPFVRYEVLEDRFVRRYNRDQIARPEFFEMGFTGKLQVTRSLEGWGASRSAWLYNAAVSRGFQLDWGHDLLASAKAERRLASTGEPLSQAGVLLRYFAPWTQRTASYALLSGDRVSSGAAAPEQLQLGGDNGLRGYPLRYQSGEKRALLTLEQRVYTDWYLFRLVRVGGAAFFDVGRAWGGVNQNAVNGGWLSDAGIGLRLSFDRASFGKVLHADIAFPLDRAPGIDSVQFLVRGVVSF